MRISFDRVRAEEVLGTLYERYLAGRYPFNLPEAQAPQIPANMPKGGFASSVDHARFLFLACLWMRGKIKSDTAIRGLSRIYETLPEAFQPEYARTLSPEMLIPILKQNALGFAKGQNARFWIENMARLDDHWRGDPRRLFDGITSYENLCKRVRNHKTKWGRERNTEGPGFMGFQKKMTSLLAYFLMEAKLVDRFDFPLPVDFHVMRIMIAHKILAFEGSIDDFSKKHILDAAREFAIEYAERHKVDSLHFSEFVWYFSRAMCDKHPGNISVYTGGRNRQTIIRAKTITWKKGQQDTYNMTCGQCPIENTCMACIPAGPYYNHGKLVIRSRRDKPPQQRLFPPTQLVLREKRKWRKEDTPAEEVPPVPTPEELGQLPLFSS